MTTTAPTSPPQVIERFGEAFNRGDLDAVMALYGPEAVFKVEPDRIVHGPAAIRDALAGLLALQPRITSRVIESVESGDIAMVAVVWEMTGNQPDGAPVSLAGRSADVLQRHPDGHWMIRIDDPWGPPGS
jgi:ketosteroid isomerase-like protein